jgi:hypothetical protein
MGVSSGFESSTSAWASVFNLGNCAIGAGILSFPYAVQRSGALYFPRMHTAENVPEPTVGFCAANSPGLCRHGHCLIQQGNLSILIVGTMRDDAIDFI